MEGVQTESSFAAKDSNHSERAATVVFQVRVVGNNHNTTPFTMVPAAKARNRDELWDEIVGKVPIVMDEKYVGTEQQAANPFHGKPSTLPSSRDMHHPKPPHAAYTLGSHGLGECN